MYEGDALLGTMCQRSVNYTFLIDFEIDIVLSFRNAEEICDFATFAESSLAGF